MVFLAHDEEEVAVHELHAVCDCSDVGTVGVANTFYDIEPLLEGVLVKDAVYVHLLDDTEDLVDLVLDFENKAECAIAEELDIRLAFRK